MKRSDKKTMIRGDEWYLERRMPPLKRNVGAGKTMKMGYVGRRNRHERLLSSPPALFVSSMVPSTARDKHRPGACSIASSYPPANYYKYSNVLIKSHFVVKRSEVVAGEHLIEVCSKS
jgi:hypothetical protein